MLANWVFLAKNMTWPLYSEYYLMIGYRHRFFNVILIDTKSRAAIVLSGYSLYFYMNKEFTSRLRSAKM